MLVWNLPDVETKSGLSQSRTANNWLSTFHHLPLMPCFFQSTQPNVTSCETKLLVRDVYLYLESFGYEEEVFTYHDR